MTPAPSPGPTLAPGPRRPRHPATVATFALAPASAPASPITLFGTRHPLSALITSQRPLYPLEYLSPVLSAPQHPIPSSLPIASITCLCPASAPLVPPQRPLHLLCPQSPPPPLSSSSFSVPPISALTFCHSTLFIFLHPPVASFIPHPPSSRSSLRSHPYFQVPPHFSKQPLVEFSPTLFLRPPDLLHSPPPLCRSPLQPCLGTFFMSPHSPGSPLTLKYHHQDLLGSWVPETPPFFC